MHCRTLTLALTIFAATMFLSAVGAAQTEKVLYSFQNNSTDGGLPYSALVIDKLGNLYGTTSAGGSNGGGTAFELSPSPTGWTEKVIYNFASRKGDGSYPVGGLIFDRAGNLYGTTYIGGSHNAGTVFELVPGAGGTWTETILHPFGSAGTDGGNPNGSLVLDAKGNLYGTTVNGGTGLSGTAFEVAKKPGGGWVEKVLHSFQNDGIDGRTPYSNLVFDNAGNLYGTTYDGGGSGNCSNGCGSVFELSPASGGVWSETIYTFNTCYTDCPIFVSGGLAFDSNGNLYGAGTHGNFSTSLCLGDGTCGTVYEMLPDGTGGWTEAGIYGFVGGSDGISPQLVTPLLDKAGNIYGTTSNGGTDSVGTVFEVSPQEGGTWTEQVLYSFSSAGTDGQSPMSSLVFDGHGNLYGTTLNGGTAGAGTVFEIER
jgi:uncharacterized repeat protein (TIGR03803 family)